MAKAKRPNLKKAKAVLQRVEKDTRHDAITSLKNTVATQRIQISAMEVREGVLLDLLNQRIRSNSVQLQGIMQARQALEGVTVSMKLREPENELIHECGDAEELVRRLGERHQRRQDVYEITGQLPDRPGVQMLNSIPYDQAVALGFRMRNGEWIKVKVMPDSKIRRHKAKPKRKTR